MGCDCNRPNGGGIGDAVAEFDWLASWKRKKGLSARVVTVDDIVAGRYGTFIGACRRDLQEVLREFIKWAYSEWGVTWLLLGGDADIIPVRKVVGYVGGITPGTTDPPEDGGSFWTGSALKLHTTAGIDDLIRTSDGRRLRYSVNGKGPTPHWSYTTDETYTNVSSLPTHYVRVDGSASDLQAEELFILNNDNAIPTDLYYASVAGYGATGGNPLYFCNARTGALGSRCTTRDWDWQDNGLYGQYNNDGDLGGQTYTADISVGRAPISSAGDAKAFVDKVIGYENAGLFSGQWIKKLLLVSSNWGGRIDVGPADPLADNTYLHATGAHHTVIQLAAAPSGLQTELIIVAADGTELALPFRIDAAPADEGWTYVRSATDMTASVIEIWVPWQLVQLPLPTRWIAVYGAGNLTPAKYVIDDAAPDGSMTDQELLRHQLATKVPGWSNVDRLYEDDIDLDPPDRAAVPLTHLTQPALETRLNAGPHVVSLSGHGNWPGCCGLDPGVNNRLANAGAPFIGYADSCLTNEFDLTYAISQDLVTNANGGAVAYIGNSRFSWIGVGDDFQRNCFAGLPATTAIGLLHDRRCAGVHLLPGDERYNRWSIFSLNLMGDPEMRLRVRAPRFPCVELAATARLDRPYVVRVLLDSSPLSQAVVTANNGEWHTQAITGHDGSAALDLTGAPMGDLSVTVTHPGLLPTTEISRAIGPIWREAEIRRLDTSLAGIQAHVRWDDVERIVGLSPCGTASLLPVLTTAVAMARPVRLYIVEDASGPVVEAASLT
jgi:peptidase C25-like protein